MEHVETVVIGGGQAGLAASYCLTQLGLEHVVLERQRIGERWRSQVWDSLTLLTPSWATRLPGFAYSGADPDGYMDRHEYLRFLEDYAASFRAPVRCGSGVDAVERDATSGGYVVRTGAASLQARNVVIATGPFQKSRSFAAEASLPRGTTSLHATSYRNPAQLPPGAVLVVGSGSSALQISEELQVSGRSVFLSIGHCPRRVRRYRGMDHTFWIQASGEFDETVDEAGSKAHGCRAQLSGVRGGHDIDYDRLANLGVVIVGRFLGIEGDTLAFSDDLPTALDRYDRSFAEFRRKIDTFIARTGNSAPPFDDAAHLAVSRAWRSRPPRPTLSLSAEGIRSVVWAAGFVNDFGWIRVPVFRSDGSPIHRRGVTEMEGLYFLGLPWLHKLKSSFIHGVGEDAAYTAEHISQQRRQICHWSAQTA